MPWSEIKVYIIHCSDLLEQFLLRNIFLSCVKYDLGRSKHWYSNFPSHKTKRHHSVKTERRHSVTFQ